MTSPEPIAPAKIEAFWKKVRGRGIQEVFVQSLVDGLLPIAQQLWEKHSGNLDVNASNFYGDGVLEAVAQSGQVRSLDFLLQRGLAPSSFSKGDVRQRTPLMKAALGGHVEMVRALAMHSPVDQKDGQGKSAFMLAIEWSQWACADELAFLSPQAQVEKGLVIAGFERLPRWAAHLERQALQESLSLCAGVPAALPDSTLPASERGSPIEAKPHSKRRRL